jgi:hypothetical protein
MSKVVVLLKIMAKRRSAATARGRGAYLPTFAILAICIGWFAVSVAPIWGSGNISAASGAYGYEYQYPDSVTGSGTITTARGQLSFSITAKTDSTGSSGSCAANEPATRTKVKCLGVTALSFTRLSDGSVQAVFSGPATVNGTATTYSITATDGDEPGVGHDSFAIHTGTGFDRSGVLTSGNIAVHSH